MRQCRESALQEACKKQLPRLNSDQQAIVFRDMHVALGTWNTVDTDTEEYYRQWDEFKRKPMREKVELWFRYVKCWS